MKFQAHYCAMACAAAIAITALAPVNVADAAPSKKDPKPAVTSIRAKSLKVVAGTSATLSAVLRQKGKGGGPIADTPITFFVKRGSRLVKLGVASTDASGSASFEMPYDGNTPRLVYKATFDGTKKYLSSSATASIKGLSPPNPWVDPNKFQPTPCPSGVPRGVLSGYVTVDGSPAGNAEVRIGTGDCGARDTASRSGYFEIKKAPVGRRTVSVKLSGSNTWKDVGPVEIVLNQTLSVELIYRTSPSGWEILPR